ncbi:MAG: TIGR02450 family Trp-rich protein [Rhodocyclaceae bacterium]|nr:TIGR02450 family Trp-rich protein [Rhodocyclaceae bacterium]MBL0075831.1 TIGR02450 family Trp-rich protein [Rhodocyclaceae bacterium]MBP6108957.1 TIGR02450 family Trp-rich protein [Rhodocyclaceae bacterium]
MSSVVKTNLNPKKLLLSKWTAVSPQNKEKHFLVTKLVPAGVTAALIETVELEAVHSRRSVLMPWRELNDQTQWLQGWH